MPKLSCPSWLFAVFAKPSFTTDRLGLIAAATADSHLLAHPRPLDRSHHSTTTITAIGAAASFRTTAATIARFT